MTYTVTSESQSLFDIAIEAYGDSMGAFWLVDDNVGIDSVTERLRVGQVLQLRDASVNPRQATYLQDFAPFATINPDADRPSGIGHWYLDEYVIQ